MEVMIPFNKMDNFEFNSAISSPFSSPPCTPKPFNGGFYFSAPPSPSHLSQFYREFDCLFVAADDDKVEITSHIDEFAFDVSQELEIGSVSAEELFDGGMIKRSPVLQSVKKNRVFSPRNKKEQETQTVKKNRVFSPRNKKDQETEYSILQTQNQRESRGKQRVSSNGLSNSSSRISARSLSPMRVSQYPWEEEEITKESAESNSNSSCSVLTSSSSKGSKKWRFKDFFLFRSASEGRASDKDPLKKYTAAGYKEGKNSSFKGNESSVSSSLSKAIVTTRTKKGKVSAHELHYTVNRALSSDLKKKTLLPYKQGIFGQLAFNPAVHAMANGFGLSRKK
ncbi:hypothetical protein RND71_027572 [Anisodus tanguticus]|uniref:Uncharacterized protein n=1 Tax=Anisodus tanguticus TaxID=243964 RepID=A0AAE1RJ13_9SOLA|nr:hypothetical protein RND71_027572 [Anisodus tanguticus]